MTQKLETVLVTAQVNLTTDKSFVGSCIRQVTLSPAQCEALVMRLRQVMGCGTDQIHWRHYKQATIIWIEIRSALLRRCLNREMRRFGRVFEDIGLAETAEICAPFKVSYQ